MDLFRIIMKTILIIAMILSSIFTSYAYAETDVATSIKVLIKTDNGKKAYYDFPRVEQWLQRQAYGDKVEPNLLLEGVPSTDKAYLYDMIKGKSIGGYTNTLDVILETITKSNKVIVSVKYTGCKIDQYWLYMNVDKTQYNYLGTNAPEPREQYYIKCIGYFVNP